MAVVRPILRGACGDAAEGSEGVLGARRWRVRRALGAR